MFAHSFFSRCGRSPRMVDGPEEGLREPGGRHGRRGGPFGRHRGGPFGGRGPRMFDPGALRLVVLGLIGEEPRHGYDIIKALEARFQGAYSPSPGSIYPMLQMLEEADLVISTQDGNKRSYAITEAGRVYLEDNRAELDRINAQLDEASADIRQSALAQEVMALRMTVFTRLRRGNLSAEQADEARKILRTARDSLDRL
ncbi:PadR family transcriptional regulator [Lichenifustis flavocetrariae]|uniref:PadR family transcriptional regulator n=1 Tax=Lichenifustis flavocetrariae TaxID=2949735 RepID=A0AA41Z435_9HYPH|nr:PadR family transcriptional regulator [Lichenifustis flavocetrariae]MCW6510118.1 PadR family transcriptional regulator [Lichenifustis flavocetrariae]